MLYDKIIAVKLSSEMISVMKNKHRKIKNKKTISYIILAVMCGMIVGTVIFLFKTAATAAISLSLSAYSFVRSEPVYFPLLVLCAALLGLLASFILKYAPEGKGGGIPTAISVLRGLINFSWIKSIFSMFTSAMLTYLCAVPLGNEGPSVQIGTAVGRGCIRLFSKKQEAWDRYLMTGGACAGFAAATGAPLTGILFAFEEAQRRFSPIIFTASAITAVCASAQMKLLCELTGQSYSLFGFELSEILPLTYLWVAAVIGLVCGICSELITKAYTSVRLIVTQKLRKLPFSLKMMLVFVIVAIFGFASPSLIGSGHDIVDALIEGQGVWYLLALYFLVRCTLMLFATNTGVTGGVFVPTLAFGAIIGALCARLLTVLQLMPEQYYRIAVVIGIASILASLSKTPIMAIAFSLEALGAVSNILCVIVGVAVAHLYVELRGILPFTDVIIEAKTEDAHRGKEAVVVNTNMTVAEGAFAVHHEIRDLLLPPSCVVLALHKNPAIPEHDRIGICAGDKIDVHYISYNVEETERVLESYVGKQSTDVMIDVHAGSENDSVPEL